MYKPLGYFALFVTLTLSGCGAAQKAPIVFVEPPPTPLTIKTVPEIVMSYTTIKVMCILPRDIGDGEYTFGVVDTFRSGGPIDRLQVSNEIVAPCEPFTIFCAYEERDPQVGFKKPVTLTTLITPVGECR